MAIAEFAAVKKRARVAFWGEVPQKSGLEAFVRRGYRPESFTVRLRAPRELAITDSVVLTQSATDLKSVYRQLRQYADKLLSFDCRIYVRVAPGLNLQGRERTTVVNAIRHLRLPGAGLRRNEWDILGVELREREGFPLAPYVCVCDASWTWDTIAQTIADNPAGDPPNLDLELDAVTANGTRLKLNPEVTLLLQRSFADCGEVHLRRMQDGLSGINVFRAYVKLRAGLEGKWPTSYFVKVGARTMIGREYFNYQAHALKYIPFYLAPRLTLERCGLGAREGIIIGDFVEQTEPLRDSARGGRSIHALGTLFSRTLAAWRHDANEDKVRTIGDVLADFLPRQMDVPDVRKALLARDFGVTPNLTKIRELLAKCDSKRILIGTIHGDLNPSNVLVRLSDAILIDFEKLKEGPLIYDVASVEAGLLVDGFAGDMRTPRDWLKSIEPLYDSHELLAWRIPCHPKDSSSWFYDCVRQIRLQATPLQGNIGQYAAALAIALIRKSCNKQIFKDRRDVLRAGAYVLGEGILEHVVNYYTKETT
jgi:Ternary complex associated domain 9